MERAFSSLFLTPIFNFCDNFPKFLLLYFSQLVKRYLRFSLGVWGRATHCHIVCSLNREVWNGRRYDFWDIVDTISELAKPYKNVESILKNVLTVSVSLHCQYRYQWGRKNHMQRDIRSIRKQFRLTGTEEKTNTRFNERERRG